MTEIKAQNRTAEHNGNRKPLVAAVCVVLVLAALLIVFLAAKNPIFFAAAQKKTENGDFLSAMELVGKADGDDARILEEYIALRVDINNCYPALLTEFNSRKIREWSGIAASVNGKRDVLGEEISADVQELSETLNAVITGVTGYEALRYDVLSMMNVFLEINRLHTKGDDGKNIGFTVAEEREKIRMWENQCASVEEYALSIPNPESAYLLNYLIKEVQGECFDLSDAIDSVIESGYSETDKVRFSGEGRKTYPDMRNSNGESVNLLEKDTYELFVYEGVCRAFAESLGEYYMPQN